MARSTRSILVTLLATLVLAACGGQQAPPTPTPAPTQAPTNTPRPTSTPRPTATPRPTEAPTAATSGELAEVEIGDLQTFTHETGVFSIDVPASWSASDSSSESEAIVVWTDPSKNALIGVNIFESQDEVSEEELTTFLQNYLNETFGDEPAFTADDPTPQADGSVLIAWGYDAEASGGIKAPLTGNSFIEQRGNKVSILTTLVPQAQFDALLEQTNQIINSYTIDQDISLSGEPAAPTSAASGQLQEVVIGDLETYTHPTGLFSIDLPTGWELNDSSKPDEAIMIWTDPSGNAFVGVDVFEEENQATQDELTAFLQNYLQQTFGSQPDFQVNDPKPQTDGSVLIVWSYTAEASGGVKAQLTGNSFIEQRGNKVSILTTLVPQEQFDALVGDTNTIINSYKLNPEAPLS